MKTKIRIWQLLAVLVLLYVSGGILLYFFQERLLFHPTPLQRDYHFSFEQKFEEVNVPFKISNLNIVKFKSGIKRKGLVLFFHGNMHHVEHYKKYPALFLRNGYDIWMIDYPGFGKTTGENSEEVLYAQALIFYDMAIREIKFDSIVIYGKSIGTGIASFLASRKPCQQLILETPYYSIAALARHYFPIYPFLPKHRFLFPVHTYLSALHIPVIIFHGTQDEVVPYSQSQLLVRENPAINLISLEKGKHNNLFEFEQFQSKMDVLLKNLKK